MSKHKTAAIAPSFHNGIVFKRKGSRVRYIDPATAKVSGWKSLRANHTGPAVTVGQVREALSPNYSRMTVAELRALAGDRGIKVPSKARKAVIIAALTETR